MSRDLKPALDENVGSEQLAIYIFSSRFKSEVCLFSFTFSLSLLSLSGISLRV